MRGNSNYVVGILGAVAVLGAIGWTNLVGAECRLPLAIAAGQYLNQLEKTKLQEYQNNSVCEVLSYEFWNCTAKQKAEMEKAFAVKEVLGNYCMPHLPPPPSEAEGELSKGAELYSWKESGGYYWYALLPGTNRKKTAKEIVAAKVSEGYLMTRIQNVPQGISLSWNSLSAVDAGQDLGFEYPQAKTVSALKQQLALRKIELLTSPD